jgi:tRNA (guanine37-N1)-methyltransferase
MSANPLFSAIALTLFPEMFPGPLGHSLAGKALEKGIWSLEAIDIRAFAHDKHATVDDKSFGGGTGMVMKPDVVDEAIEAAKAKLPKARLVYTSPRGVPLTQGLVEELKNTGIIVLCGRFEGVDHRVIEHHNMLEVSLGDFVLSGGEIAALAMLDACVRLLPGVIGKEDAITQESFSTTSTEYAGLLEYPHYTRPSFWKGYPVPEVLLSGNHEQIRLWRLEQAKKITAARRPDIWAKIVEKKE